MADTTSFAPVAAMLRIGTREIRKFVYYKFGREAVASLNKELVFSFLQAAKIARHEANVLIKGGEGANLARASKTEVQVSGNDITAIVDWDSAVSDGGFHYAAAVDRGRKAFGPVNKKFLRFEIDAKEIFTKWVKAAPAQNFTGRGKTAAMPAIVGTINGGIHRWAVAQGLA